MSNYAVGVRQDGSNQPYLRNRNQPMGGGKWYFPPGTDFIRKLSQALSDLADDMEHKGIAERDVQE